MTKELTRSESLAHLIEGEILSGAVPPGARLDEQSLATRFGVSRTPVREALRQLAASGLVRIRPHHGAIVRELTLTELLEMFQVIAELEGLAARLAARRIEKQETARLRRSNEACRRHATGRDENAFNEENDEFHDIILVASRNKFLIDEVRDLRRRINPYRRYVSKQAGVMEKSVKEHAGVVAAIEKGDGPAAHDLMRAHLNMVGEEAGDFVAFISMIDGSQRHRPKGGERPPARRAGRESRSRHQRSGARTRSRAVEPATSG